jgi:hypothetical protein
MRCHERIQQLEEYRRKQMPPSHFVTSVRVPWYLPAGVDHETWLQEEVMCSCSQRRCPELRIGLVVLTKAPSAEAWAERAQQYYAQWRVHDA